MEIPLVSVKCRTQNIVGITENIILTGCKGTNKQTKLYTKNRKSKVSDEDKSLV